MSCNNNSTKLIIGRYASVRPSYPFLYYQYFANGIRSYGLGSELILNTDSTFEYLTCGNIMTGKWATNSDSLLLTIFSNKYRNDSLNKVGIKGKFPVIPKEPIALIIKGNKLTYFMTMIDGKKSIDMFKINIQ
ncbi:MAG: hypothetical protein K9H61_03060 [Bacteroidia bacterium]|nr:hypothetical protein [Bacteroidia bacterium]